MPGPGTERVTGFGDIQEQIYLTPQKPGALIWGIGPVLSFPTAHERPGDDRGVGGRPDRRDREDDRPVGC